MLTIKNNRPVFCAGLVSILLLLAGCAPPGVRALYRGQRLIERGNFTQAVEELKSAATLLETNAQAWNYYGLACHYAGQADEAERAYQRALVFNPDLAEAWFNLGCLYAAENKFDAAKRGFTTFTLSRGNVAEGFLKLGAAQLHSREMADARKRAAELTAAEKSFSEALRLNPASAEALNGLGVVKVQQGRPDEAAPQFAEAVRLQPGFGPALLNWAIVAQQSVRDPALAVKNYRAYLALNPAPDNADAVRAVVRQLELENPPAAHPPAVVSGGAGKPSNSSPSPQVGPAAEEPLLNPAQDESPAETISQAESGESKRTAVDAASVLAPVPAVSKPSRPGFFQRLFGGGAKSPVRTKSPSPMSGASGSNAVVSARYAYHAEASPVSGNRPEAQRVFARAFRAHQARRLAEAMEGYRRAAQLDPSFYEAHYNLGLAAAQTGDHPTALAAYEAALAARPDAADARYNFALILRQSNYLLDAANELEKITTAFPGDARAHIAAGNLYVQQLRQPVQARRHYQKVLEVDPHNSQAAAIKKWLAENPPPP